MQGTLPWTSCVRRSDRPILHLQPLRRAPNLVDRDGMEFNNKAERVKQELWVSLTIM
jgi:hypothetical protein